MARKPNYNFERQERERLKKQKSQDRADEKAKAEKEMPVSPDPADDKLERLLQALARGHRDLLVEDRHLFDVYCTATETSRAPVRKHRARLRQLLERVLDEGIATAKFDPRDRDRALAFISDAVYRFINPPTVRLDAEVPKDILDQRLSTMIRVVLRALANGSV